MKKDLESNEYYVKFKHWVNERKFQLLTYSGLGLYDVLCLPVKSTVRKGHIGARKTWAQVGKMYQCVPYLAFDKYVALCVVCHLRKPQTTRTPLNPLYHLDLRCEDK